jgi:hypothetical protein
MNGAKVTCSSSIRLRDVDIHFGEGKTAVQALRGIDLDARRESS